MNYAAMPGQRATMPPNPATGAASNAAPNFLSPGIGSNQYGTVPPWLNTARTGFNFPSYNPGTPSIGGGSYSPSSANWQGNFGPISMSGMGGFGIFGLPGGGWTTDANLSGPNPIYGTPQQIQAGQQYEQQVAKILQPTPQQLQQQNQPGGMQYTPQQQQQLSNLYREFQTPQQSVLQSILGGGATMPQAFNLPSGWGAPGGSPAMGPAVNPIAQQLLQSLFGMGGFNSLLGGGSWL